MRTIGGKKLNYSTRPEKTSLAVKTTRNYGSRPAPGPLSVADAYEAYHGEATEGTLDLVFRAISRYASHLASMHLEPADREDAAQEAVIYCWRQLAKYDPNRGKFQQWCLAKILAAFSSYRRAKLALKRGSGFQIVTLFPDDVDAAYPV